MKLTTPQLQHLVHLIFENWKTNHVVTFKEDEGKVAQRALAALQAELQKEMDLEREVDRMLNELEKSHAGEFQRFKMYPILKSKLAKEKKVIL